MNIVPTVPTPTPAPPPATPLGEVPFRAFPKLPRDTKVQAIVTEKIDGTNACVVVAPDGRVAAQSRKRLVTPEDDNYGFAAWVARHEDELRELGPGYHFGEWWGQGIQRGYGLKERRFSLFNVTRWAQERPRCCHVVPTLYVGTVDLSWIRQSIGFDLLSHGSYAAPGYLNPEGMVVFITELNASIKMPFNPNPKGAQLDN